MDMGKYVAVGVLAVIVLAAVTYEAPKTPGGGTDPQRISGEVGARTEAASREPEAIDAQALDPAAAPQADVAPTATATPTTPTAPTAPTAAVADAASALQAAAPEVVKYTVKAGQTLSDVAQELLGDRGRWRELYRHNQGQLPSPDVVRAGLILVFPAQEVARKAAPTSGGTSTTLPAGAPRVATETTTASAPRPGERSYVVAKGDTLFSIARRELGQGARWREIVSLNGLVTETVAAGTRLRLPAR